MSLELSRYIKLFFSLDNPVYYSILFTVLLFTLLYLIFRYVVYPLQKKYILENQALELKNARLMALFAELDPDPVIRIDSNEKIIFTNHAAKFLEGNGSPEGKQLSEIIPAIDFPVSQYINEDKSKDISQVINSKNYSILFRGISSLNIAQIYFHDITDKVLYEKKLRDLTENLQNKIEEDRKRIARELHDGIGQNLLLLKMNLIKNYQEPLSQTGQEKNFGETIVFLQNTIAELKMILFNLKPPILEDMGLAPAVTALVQRVSDESSIKGSVNIMGLEERVDAKIETAIYRIVQEALNNIVKHSHASEFSVQMMNKDRLIKLMIIDNGNGFTADKMHNISGFGLLNMKERAESFKGSFKIESSAENGTLIVINIPLENRQLQNHRKIN